MRDNVVQLARDPSAPLRHGNAFGRFTLLGKATGLDLQRKE